MGLLNEDLEDTKTSEENGEEKTPYYGPNAIYAKIPCNYKNGRNAFQLQSNEDYSFDDGYTYYLLPSKFESGGDPQMNADTFNYGESTNDGRTVIAGTYTLLKVKDNSEIFEGKPFNTKRPPTGGPLKPETGSWTELINDAKSWTIDLFFEGKDSTLKSIYSDTSNFLNPTIKTLTHQGVEPTGWGLNDVGNISSVDRFKDIPEVTTATEYMLDINSDGKITFFIRNPRLTRLIPIWDGNQLTFKKATGSEKHGEIIITTPKVEESKFRYKKNLLNEDTKTGCIEGDCQNGQGTYIDSDGNKYVGQFKNGKYNGQGTLTFSNGSEYVGGFKDDLYNGQGTYTYSDGSKYVGEFKDELFNGQGTYTNTSGCEFSGEWIDDILNGKETNDFDKITNCTEKPKENEVNNVVTLEQKPTKFEIVADDVFSNLIQGKIPKVTIVSYTEPILDEDGHYDYVYLKAKINNIVYDLNFSPLGLNIQDSAGNHKKAVWDNKNLTVRNFTKEEKKDAEEDYRLLSDIQLLGGDKFQMEETLIRFKQLIK